MISFMTKVRLIDRLFNVLFNTSFQIITLYRLANFSYKHKIPVIVAMIRWWQHVIYSCEISYSSKIGKNIKLPHPLGIVIGSGVIIKDNVTIFQQVTLGGKGGKNELNYPIIENGVIIYSGAKILGGITIGQNSIIGSNSVVISDIPPNSLAVGVPARIIDQKSMSADIG